MNNLSHFEIYKFVTSLPLLFVSAVYAGPLANGPLFLGGNISPNVMFTLDDSGSMQFEIMPGDLIKKSVRYMFPRASSVYGADSYSNYVVGFNGADFDSNNQYTASLRSSHVNKIYYNPAVRYLPWSNSDGSLMGNASPTCAPHNPKNTGAGCRNLTVNNTQTARWLKKDGERSGSDSRTFYPAVYFKYNGGDVNSASSYTEIEIKSSTTSYVGSSDRTDCAAAPTCDYNEEIQNFANWYTYYRSRILMTRAGIGSAFAVQGNTMRVGFASLNLGTEGKGDSVTTDGVSSKAVINGVRQFTGTDRVNFFNNLYGHTVPAEGTPLRIATDEVGKYYQRTDDKGPWSDTPGANGGTQLECRQNYNILMTDGYWSGDSPGVGNVDNTAGSSITNDSNPAIPATYTYTPALPYSDAHSNTLADVAMHYWKTDLRTDMLNKVPANTADPAFWQHMVNITVGLGVDGSLSEIPAGADTWPEPTTNATKIDDLWHAAVNSRGAFFSASEPGSFAEALTNSLSTILARIGSASAVATSSSELRANGRVYIATFNSGDWSGQLLSIPIDTQGLLGVTEWDAGAVSMAPNTISPTTRVVLTKGSSDGVAFEYANLTTAQKAFLDKDTAGTVDNCGVERVAFLRGASTKEGAGGTFSCSSASVINKLRNRTISKLGDIVRSSPVFVDVPNAGHSDVDHAGYTTFKTSYKSRTPMVYVGANDGTVHGFNACVSGVTAGCSATDEGKELIAYVPSMVYGNLSRLTDKEYNDNHRFYVDSSPMVADAYTGATPSWKSVLVGGLAGGGKGYYALDVTDPTVFTAANAAKLVLWEFSDVDDVDMGYSYNLPSVNPFTGQALQITKMENNKWAVIVGNGYNSTGGKAALYVLFIAGGEDGTWTLGSDYIKLVADSGTGNGLSTPVPFDSDGNGLADVIYAGDIKGNLWKFDVGSNSPGSWNVAIGGLPLFVSGTGKPIISPPVISFHPDGGQLVMFGTGKYLEIGDTTNTDTQSTYGIWDHNTTASVTTSDLVSQVITDATVRTSTQNLVTYSATVKGWYFDMPIGGERLTGVPSLEDGLLTFATILPSSSPCDFGGRGFVYTVDYLTGGMLDYPAFDTNGNRIIASDDGLSTSIEISFSIGGVTRIRGEHQDVLVYSKAGGGGGGGGGGGPGGSTPAAKGPASLRGRITWREIINQ